MRKTKSQKQFTREEKRSLKEKKKQIELANKMLIPVPKTTMQSLKLLSFDPKGTFRFDENRWIKVYKLTKNQLSTKEISKADLFEGLHARVRITTKLDGDTKETYLTLTQSGMTYDEVRSKFMKDEEALLRHLSLDSLDVNAVMQTIAGKKKDFSYASMVRGKRDWKAECFPEITEHSHSFRMDGTYGECSFMLQFPYVLHQDVFAKFRELGCEVWLATDLQGIGATDQIDYIRTLELKYNKRLSVSEAMQFMNVSMQVMFFCDSDDARDIIEKTISVLFAKEGFVLFPVVGAQKLSAESILSFGLVERSCMKNVSKKLVDQIQM